MQIGDALARIESLIRSRVFRQDGSFRRQNMVYDLATDSKGFFFGFITSFTPSRDKLLILGPHDDETAICLGENGKQGIQNSREDIFESQNLAQCLSNFHDRAKLGFGRRRQFCSLML